MLRQLLLKYRSMVVRSMRTLSIIRLCHCMTSSFLQLLIQLTSMVNLFISNVVVMKSDSLKFDADFVAKFHPYTPMYNSQRDVQAVEPHLAIDIAEVYRTGVVPNSAPAFVDRYNDAQEPDAIIGRPRNDFETERIVSAVNAGIREAVESKAE